MEMIVHMIIKMNCLFVVDVSRALTEANHINPQNHLQYINFKVYTLIYSTCINVYYLNRKGGIVKSMAVLLYTYTSNQLDYDLCKVRGGVDLFLKLIKASFFNIWHHCIAMAFSYTNNKEVISNQLQAICNIRLY